jgi:adenylyltransferase/sulfurtransferase
MTDASVPMEISCQQVKQLQDEGADFFFLDCREPDEHATANIPTATLVPMSQLMARAEELKPHIEKRVVVHCHHGGRSLRVAKWLREQGFSQAQSMAGGIDGWACGIDTSIPRY